MNTVKKQLIDKQQRENIDYVFYNGINFIEKDNQNFGCLFLVGVRGFEPALLVPNRVAMRPFASVIYFHD